MPYRVRCLSRASIETWVCRRASIQTLDRTRSVGSGMSMCRWGSVMMTPHPPRSRTPLARRPAAPRGLASHQPPWRVRSRALPLAARGDAVTVVGLHRGRRPKSHFHRPLPWRERDPGVILDFGAPRWARYGGPSELPGTTAHFPLDLGKETFIPVHEFIRLTSRLWITGRLGIVPFA